MPEPHGLAAIDQFPPRPGVPPKGTLLWLHAFPLHARLWEPQRALASEGWRVVAPHLRGFAAPEGGVSPETTMDDYAADVVQLARALDAGPVVLGGLSLGGYVAFAVLRRAPDLVRGLILADTRAEADADEARRNRDRLIRVAREDGVSAIADEMVPKLLGRTSQEEQPALATHVRSLVSANHADAVVAALHAMKTRPDSTALLPGIRVPALVIVGAEDLLTPPPLSRAMAGAIPAAALVELARAGHLPNLEQPEAFNTAVRSFLHRL